MTTVDVAPQRAALGPLHKGIAPPRSDMSPGVLLQYAVNGIPEAIIGGGQAIRDKDGVLRVVNAGVPGIEGGEYISTTGGFVLPAAMSVKSIRTRAGRIIMPVNADPTELPGYLGEGARVNKCECRKANPTDTSNLTTSGDPAVVLGVETVAASVLQNAIDGRGNPIDLSKVCTSLRVYVVDNSAGTSVGAAKVLGYTGNLNDHYYSAYCLGNGYISRSGGVVQQAFNTSALTRIALLGPGVSESSALYVHANAGEIVYFILPVLEEGDCVSSEIVDPTGVDPLTSITRPATVNAFSTAHKIRGQNCAVLGTVIPKPGQSTDSMLLASYATSPTRFVSVQIKDASIRLRKYNVSLLGEPTVDYAHSAYTPFQYLAYWTSAGMGIAVREKSGGSWGDWTNFATDDNAAETPIANTIEMGSRSGALHFFANYPSLKTVFIPQLSSHAEVQAWLMREAVWQEVLADAA